ncbi:hypothetical protein ABEB36_010103 [Hypothenemus hampei]|uniref:alkaline phosphatase n=1 Tax=Hypothenemus hampei TaxID=57062 RepID=A0ABD1EIN6_HYPHA
MNIHIFFFSLTVLFISPIKNLCNLLYAVSSNLDVLWKQLPTLFCNFLYKDEDVRPFPNKLMRPKSEEELLMERTKGYWRNAALNTIADKLRQRMNFNTAKNVIFFLGDGMSVPTITATRVYMGGEEKSLAFETFPYTGLSKTYCVDHQTADSACSATAYLTGVKANLGTIGVTAAVNLKNCTAMNQRENQLDSIAKLFQLQGRRTGLVTTTRVTHATPAGLYAHTADRHWETDTDVSTLNGDVTDCEDIAHQLVFGKTGQQLNVILGGGRRGFLPREVIDEQGNSGVRSDGLNLIEEWIKFRENHNQSYQYIWNRDQLLNIQNGTDYLLGLFQSSHMNYNKERNTETQPSLEEMTEAAIKVLDKQNSSGYFLLVEGGRIDMAHHYTWAHKALDETAEFSKAIQRAVEITNEENTLIVVTAGQLIDIKLIYLKGNN